MLATSLKTGTIFKDGGQPWRVDRYEHTKTARGGATIKVMARNLLTDQVLEKRYQSTAKVEDADVTRKSTQYLYKDQNYFFMDPTTYEQFSLPEEVVGDNAKFLLEGEKVQVMYFDGKPMAIELPATMVFEITDTTPGFKGNTVSNVYKDATLSNGSVIKVPSHIRIGDKIKINTMTGEYASKS